MTEKYRLITRSDFDGLVCAAVLKEKGILDEILFVHPKDMQDGKIEVTDKDITTNLPYVPGCYMAFDHHASEIIRNQDMPANYVNDPSAASAARVVYDYFGGEAAFPRISQAMMLAVDKADSAMFTKDEIVNPKGWVLLNYLMDSRTGLGRFRDFRISNYQLMMQLIDYCIDHNIEEILKLPDVVERSDLYFQQEEQFKAQLQRCSTVYKNLVVLDLRKEEIIHAGNRFMIYALYPDCNISIHAIWGFKQQNTVFAIGKSIINHGSKTHVGELCLSYAGGGHNNAGTCQVDNDKAETVLQELIAKINADG